MEDLPNAFIFSHIIYVQLGFNTHCHVGKNLENVYLIDIQVVSYPTKLNTCTYFHPNTYMHSSIVRKNDIKRKEFTRKNQGKPIKRKPEFANSKQILLTIGFREVSSLCCCGCYETNLLKSTNCGRNQEKF